MALFRVYENGKPLDTKDYLKWNPKGARDGELVFVSGHPGCTERLDTVAQLSTSATPSSRLVIKMLEGPHRRAGAILAHRAPSRRARRLADLRPAERVKAFEGRYKGLLDPARHGQEDIRMKTISGPR